MNAGWAVAHSAGIPTTNVEAWRARRALLLRLLAARGGDA